MIITAIQIRKLVGTGNKMVGVCSLTLDGMIALHDIKIMQTDSNMFIAMPSRRTKNGKFKDIVHPISAPPREKIEQLIFGLYEKLDRLHSTNVSFRCENLERKSLLEQECSDFIQDDSRTYSDFVSDEIKSEIDSWWS